MKELTAQEREAVALLRNMAMDPSQGLPQELFLLISGLIPLPNVDLLVENGQGQILLSRRADAYFQHSWHIPGGCLRYGETLENRVQETALRELGSPVAINPEPVAARNVIRGVDAGKDFPRERGHTVAILYRCTLPEGFVIDNGSLTEQDNGYLKWFDTLPKDFMEIQYVYADILKKWIKKEI